MNTHNSRFTQRRLDNEEMKDTSDLSDTLLMRDSQPPHICVTYE